MALLKTTDSVLSFALLIIVLSKCEFKLLVSYEMSCFVSNVTYVTMTFDRNEPSVFLPF